MLLDTAVIAKPKKISLTPLIDVVFILLLFFMLSSTFTQWRQITISAPSQDTTAVTHEKLIVSLLSNDGSIQIGEEQFYVSQTAKLASVINLNQDRLLVLEADNTVNTQTLVGFVDTVKQLGASHVSIAGVQ
jgi:biopolymer transport protein ExbD